jgi:hypothetical protein
MGSSGTELIPRLSVRVVSEQRSVAEADRRRRIQEALDRHHRAPIGAAG